MNGLLKQNLFNGLLLIYKIWLFKLFQTINIMAKRNYKKVYHFFNKAILCEDVSTVGDMVTRRGLNRKELYNLVDGLSKEYKGWYLK